MVFAGFICLTSIEVVWVIIFRASQVKKALEGGSFLVADQSATAVITDVRYSNCLHDIRRNRMRGASQTENGYYSKVDYSCCSVHFQWSGIPWGPSLLRLVLSLFQVVPFRLTRNMINGFGPTGVEGPFRRSCESTLRVMRDNKDTLLTVRLHSTFHRSSSRPSHGSCVCRWFKRSCTTRCWNGSTLRLERNRTKEFVSLSASAAIVASFECTHLCSAASSNFTLLQRRVCSWFWSDWKVTSSLQRLVCCCLPTFTL